MRIRLGDPAIKTLTIVFAVSGIALALRALFQSGEGTTDELARSGPFTAWIVLASIFLVAFLDMIVTGLHHLREGVADIPAWKSRTYLYVYWVFAFAVLGLLRIGGRGGPQIGLPGWDLVTLVLLVYGALAAYPEVVRVWALHEALNARRHRIEALPPPARTGGDRDPAWPDRSVGIKFADWKVGGDVGARDDRVTELDEHMRLLLFARAQIVRVLTRLMILVVAAVILSGALRAAVVPDHVPASDFPAEGVLVYGAFFTGVLAVVVVPLMVSWRRTALLLAERVHPRRFDCTAEDLAARDRMLAMLNVNGSIFTFPVTFTALLAPLLTSLVSLWVPQLGA